MIVKDRKRRGRRRAGAEKSRRSKTNTNPTLRFLYLPCTCGRANYSLIGETMMCARCVPGFMIQGWLGAMGASGRPVEAAVAKGR